MCRCPRCTKCSGGDYDSVDAEFMEVGETHRGSGGGHLSAVCNCWTQLSVAVSQSL